jgi:transposase-like protein
VAVFIDAIVVKVREGQVANRPIYAAIGVTVDGRKDVLGLWAGSGGEGAKLDERARRREEPRRARCVLRRLRRPQRTARHG